MNKLIFLCFLFVWQVSVSQEEKADAGANANNPLANIKAFNIQFNYLTNNTSTDTKTMVTSIRYAQPIGKFLVRATMPILSTSSPAGGSSMTVQGLIFSRLIWPLRRMLQFSLVRANVLCSNIRSKNKWSCF